MLTQVAAVDGRRFQRLYVEMRIKYPIEWWPTHLHPVFAAVGKAMNGGRLYPEMLASVPQEFGGILPDHLVSIRHVSAKEIGGRKGHYILTINGPRFAGGWRFASGDLERLSRSAVKVNCEERPI